MKVVHNTISVEFLRDDDYGLYFQDDDGNNNEYICMVTGRDSAVEVARRIAKGKVEYVKYDVKELTYEEVFHDQ